MARQEDCLVDFLDGTIAGRRAEGTSGGGKPERHALLSLSDELGRNVVHRAHVLDEMIKLLPNDIAHFKTHLQDVEEDAKKGTLVLKVTGGSSAEADGVVGCDRTKSWTREIIVGEKHPSAKGLRRWEVGSGLLMPVFAHNPHALTFPVDHGETFSLFDCCTNPKEWPSDVHLTLPAKRDNASEDFKEFGPSVLKQVKMTKENMDIDRHGAGAGFCTEDSAILCAPAGGRKVQSSEELEAAFAAFNASWRERTQRLVQSSRRVGDLYKWRDKVVGKEFGNIETELKERFEVICNDDIDKAVTVAREGLEGDGFPMDYEG